MKHIVRIVCVILALALPAMAQAHAQFKGSEPSPNALIAERPEAVVLWFSEPVSPVAMRWISPGGESFSVTAEPGNKQVLVPPPPEAGDGSYLLAWRVVSLDGHPVGGTLVLSVGATSDIPTLGNIDWPPVSTWSVILMKFALSACLALGIGGTVYCVFVARDMRRTNVVTSWALYLIFPTAALLVGAQGLDLLGLRLGAILSFEPWATGADTSILRTALLSAFAGLAALIVCARWLPSGHRVFHYGLILVAWGLAAVSFAVSGHTATAEPEWQAVIASVLHGIAMIFWIGALPPLLHLVRQGDQTLPELQRFSAMAIPLVLLLLASGFFMVTIHAGSGGFETIGMSGYGMLLFVKLVAVAGLLLVAAHNRLVLTPALRRGAPDAGKALRGSIHVEIVLALMIIAFASAFRLTPPPQSLLAEPQPKIVAFAEDNIAVDLEMAPGVVGPNVVSLTVGLTDGAALDPVEVNLGFSMPEKNLGPIVVGTSQMDGKGWVTTPFVLPLPGEWQLSVDLFVTDFDLKTLVTNISIEP